MNAPHPASFYVAHQLFDNPATGRVWGGLTDGPADWSELRERIVDVFRAAAPTPATLKVLHFPDLMSGRDVTEDVIAALADCWPADEPDELDELTDRAWMKTRADRDNPIMGAR